jgi:hypothetical protein
VRAPTGEEERSGLIREGVGAEIIRTLARASPLKFQEGLERTSRYGSAKRHVLSSTMDWGRRCERGGRGRRLRDGSPLTHRVVGAALPAVVAASHRSRDGERPGGGVFLRCKLYARYDAQPG